MAGPTIPGVLLELCEVVQRGLVVDAEALGEAFGIFAAGETAEHLAFAPGQVDRDRAALVDELTVSPNSQARVRFTYGGGLAYYDA